MKPFLPIAFAMFLFAGSTLAQAPANFETCDADPIFCLELSVALAEENGASVGNMRVLQMSRLGVLARYQDFARAVAIAERLERADDIASAQIALAEAFGRAGRKAEAIAAITKATEAVSLIQYPTLQLDYWAIIAGVQMQIGELEAAQTTLAPVLAELEGMPAGYSRNALVIKVIDSGVLFQDIEAAQTLIRSIDSVYDLDEPIIRLSSFLAHKGQPDRALAEVMTIEKPEIRVSALVELSLVFSDIGEAVFARQAADDALRSAIRGGTSRSRAFAMVRAVKAFARLGDTRAAGNLFPRALVEAQNGMDRSSYSGFLIELSESYRLSGELEQAAKALETAFETVQDIGLRDERMIAMLEVIVAFTRLGKTNRAFDIIWSQTDGNTQAIWLIYLADELG